jgi:hypothetical protein
MGLIACSKAILLVLVVFSVTRDVFGLKYSVDVKKGMKPAIYLDKFVFGAGGVLNATLELSNARIDASGMNVGIFAVISRSSSAPFTFGGHRCPLDPLVVQELNANSSKLQFRAYELNEATNSVQVEVNRALRGTWSLHFVICGKVPLNYAGTLHLALDNIDVGGGQSYLSLGDLPLPYIYLFAGLAYVSLLGVWGRMMASPQRATTTIHWLMMLLLLFKSLSTFCESFMYFTMASTGEPKGWNIAFYVFQTLRALFLFLIILMIGSGWQMVKAFLSDSDRYVFWIVIPLQVAANIGLNICDERGIRNYWFYFFHLLDIICCMLVLLPIIRNIESLQGKADEDNKIKKLLQKLERLSRFYMIVVGYIYVTRVIDALLSSFLPPSISWISGLIVEMATISFYLLSGYEFRPARDNTLFHSVEDGKDYELGPAK